MSRLSLFVISCSPELSSGILLIYFSVYSLAYLGLALHILFKESITMYKYTRPNLDLENLSHILLAVILICAGVLEIRLLCLSVRLIATSDEA